MTTVNIEGLRNAADFMRQQTGEDPKWLRRAADEIERLRKQNDRLEKEVREWQMIVMNLESQVKGAAHALAQSLSNGERQ